MEVVDDVESATYGWRIGPTVIELGVFDLRPEVALVQCRLCPGAAVGEHQAEWGASPRVARYPTVRGVRR